MSQPKKRYGLAPKTRTLQEINNEYQQHALQAGHKCRIVADMEKQLPRIQSEIEDHIQTMIRLTAEADGLPRPQPSMASAPTPPQVKEEKEEGDLS
jgi:hypothetical protein